MKRHKKHKKILLLLLAVLFAIGGGTAHAQSFSDDAIYAQLWRIWSPAPSAPSADTSVDSASAQETLREARDRVAGERIEEFKRLSPEEQQRLRVVRDFGTKIGVVSFSIPPVAIGDPITLQWRSVNAADCSIGEFRDKLRGTGSYPPVDGVPSFEASGTYTMANPTTSAQERSFRIVCRDESGKADLREAKYASVIPVPGPDVTASVDKTTITTGDSATFQWSAKHADACRLQERVEVSHRGFWGFGRSTFRFDTIRETGANGSTYTKQLDDAGRKEFRVLCESEVGEDIVSMNVQVNEPQTQTQNTVPRQTFGDGGTVICTELNRQGFLSDELYSVEAEYGKTRVDPYTMYGYQLWAKPLVKLMRKSERFTRVVNVVAHPWINQMAYEMGAREEGSLVGKAMMALGMPVSKTIGVVAVTWQEGIEHRLAQK